MPILYERLQVPQDSTVEQIERSYRALAYIHMKQRDKSKMVDLNDSYHILRDPYKRSFYDRYGDEYMQSLLSPADSFFITRLLTLRNVYCLIVYVFLNTANFFFLGLIYKAFAKHTIFRYMLFISSPLLLVIVSINTSRHLQLRDRNMMRINLCVLMAIFNSISIAILTLKLGILCLASVEAAVNICLFVHTRYDTAVSNRLQRFTLVKAILMCLYYLGPRYLHYFIPCFVCLGASVFNVLVGVALSMLIFPMCLSIFLSEATSYVVLPNVIHAIHGALGCLILFNFSSAAYRLLVRGNNKILSHRLAICESADIRTNNTV